MPIHEADPWRMQYFEHVSCPDDVHIPTEDGDAWAWYPDYKWVYNKLSVAETQNLPCAPHGLDPSFFPVFSKPIYNMRGMGAGTRILRTLGEYKSHQRPGHMWMPLLEGEHVSSDAAVVDGVPMWWRHVIGKPLDGGMFDYWIVLAEPRPEIESYCAAWTGDNLRGYTGMVNFETIGARIIEVHLRFSDQWPDLYGAGWADALVGLYAAGAWKFDNGERPEGYSVVLFGVHGVQYAHPPTPVVDELRRIAQVSSIQITFHDDRPASAHSMPPGGFRLAIVNCWELQTGFHIREKLALSFWSTQRLLPRRGRRTKVTATDS